MLEERNINLAQFLTSRGEEISTLNNILKSKFLNKKSINKIPYQILDKHLRRRAMSHNRYRIPSSLRKQMNVEALKNAENSQRIIKCRKHIRKSKQLMFLYNKRSNKVQWLETHLHQVFQIQMYLQAKRMKMVDHFGFKVAEKSIEKNWRAVHRYEEHGVAVFDLSYYAAVYLQDFDYNKHNNYEEIMLPEGPALVLHRPPNEQMLLVHPGMINSLQLRYPNCVIRKNELCIFQLFGPQACHYLKDLLSKTFNLSYGEVNYCQVPLISSYKSVTQHTYKTIKTLNDVDLTRMNQEIGQNSQIVVNSFWEPQKEENFKLRFKTAIRSRFTHHKRDKLKFQQQLLESKKQQRQSAKKKGPQEDQAEKKEKPVEINPENEKKALKWLLNEKEKLVPFEDKMIQEKPTEIDLLILSPLLEVKTSLGLGYKVIVNQGKGLNIWRYFF